MIFEAFSGINVSETETILREMHSGLFPSLCEVWGGESLKRDALTRVLIKIFSPKVKKCSIPGQNSGRNGEMRLKISWQKQKSLTYVSGRRKDFFFLNLISMSEKPIHS